MSSIDRLSEIVLIELDPHEIQAEVSGGDRSASESKKGIHREFHA